MSRLLRRASLRHLIRHPWQLGLAVLGVSLGVGVVFSIDVANGSAQRAFEMSSVAVTGRATHQIEGGGAGLPESLYRDLRIELGVRASAPVVEGYVSPLERPRRVLHLLGVDPFAEEPFRTYLDRAATDSFDLEAFMTRPGAALMARQTALELGLETGDRFAVDIGGAVRQLQLVGTLTAADALRRQTLGDLLVVDISTAQETLALIGRLSRIDLIAPSDDDREPFLERVRARLPGDARLSSSASRGETAEQMTRAFRLNLQALSLLALLCGAFLVYNTMTFAVVQRRPMLATLRALGTTRRQIFSLILGEALLLGIAGTLIGGLLGSWLGRQLLALVTQTINDLYFVLNVRQISIPPWTLVKGAVVGIGATLAAALGPAWEATSTTPREALTRSEIEARAHRALPWATLVGLVLLAGGASLLAVGSDSIWLGFFSLFAVLIGLALLTPVATMALMALATPLAGRALGQLGRLSTRGVAATLSRTGVAIAALMMALAVTVGVDLMIRSFRSTVDRWLEYSLPADLYLSVLTSPGRRFATAGVTLGPELRGRLRQLPGVEGLNAIRHFEATVDGRPARAIALELEPRARTAFSFLDGDLETIWSRFDAGDGVLVSEPYAYRNALEAGDRLVMATPRGPLRLEIAGVYYDYSSELGVVMLNRRLYERTWSDDGVTAISLHVDPSLDLSQVAERVRQALDPRLALRVVSNRELRDQSMRVFDRTFLITGVLRLLAVLVAFVGILSALMALQLERTRELGVLRACGLTPGQLWRLVTQQTGFIGLTAGLLSLPVGVVMAAIMVYVINRRSFGWTLELEISGSTLLQALLVAVLAALLAGVVPAWRMAATSPAESLREE